MNSELLNEEVLLDWVQKRRQDPTDLPRSKLFAEPNVQAFVEWLEQEEEDDDDDDEDEEEDNDEDGDAQ